MRVWVRGVCVVAGVGIDTTVVRARGEQRWVRCELDGGDAHVRLDGVRNEEWYDD